MIGDYLVDNRVTSRSASCLEKEHSQDGQGASCSGRENRPEIEPRFCGLGFASKGSANISAQTRGSAIGRLTVRHRLTQVAKSVLDAAAFGTIAQMLLGFACSQQIEFTIHVGMNQLANLFVVHDFFAVKLLERSVCS